jgi:hypothetical protein
MITGMLALVSEGRHEWIDRASWDAAVLHAYKDG